jgi:hypothetical protein
MQAFFIQSLNLVGRTGFYRDPNFKKHLVRGSFKYFIHARLAGVSRCYKDQGFNTSGTPL